MAMAGPLNLAGWGICFQYNGIVGRMEGSSIVSREVPSTHHIEFDESIVTGQQIVGFQGHHLPHRAEIAAMKFRSGSPGLDAADSTRRRIHHPAPLLTPRLISLIVAASACLLLIWWSKIFERPASEPAIGAGRDHSPRIIDSNHVLAADSAERRMTSSPISISATELQNVQDNTTFRAAESTAWFQILQEVSRSTFTELASQSTAVVGYRQLADQPDAYRGQVVSLQGTMARAQWVPAARNEFEVQGYGQCWLRTDDGVEPVVVYTPRREPDLADCQDRSVQVRVVGVFFKRWAYRSLEGLRTAPLVIGLLQTGAARSIPSKPPGEHRLRASPPTPDLAEYWRLWEIDKTWWDRFQDGMERRPDEWQATEFLLQCLPRIPASSWQRDQIYHVDWEDILQDPRAWRGRVLHVTGRLLRVESLTADGPPYRCNIRLPQASSDLELLTNQVPEALRPRPPQSREPMLDERVSSAGMFLQIEDREEGPVIIVVAPRLAWHPDHVDPVQQISSDLVALTGLGFDVGSLDEVDLSTALDQGEREAFYQLLSVVGRAVDRDASWAAWPDVPVTQLLQATLADRGRCCSLVGTARSAVPVAVDDADIEERFGFREYYEVIVFVEPDMRVQVVDRTGSAKEFATYPIVYCCREWPADWPLGEGIHVPVRVSGVFLTNWQYRSEFLSGDWQIEGAGRAIQPITHRFSADIASRPQDADSSV